MLMRYRQTQRVDTMDMEEFLKAAQSGGHWLRCTAWLPTVPDSGRSHSIIISLKAILTQMQRSMP